MLTPSLPQVFPSSQHEHNGIPISHDEPTPEQKAFFHALIPFAAHLFDDPERPPRPFLTSILPLKDEHIASREALEALHDIFVCGTLKTLCNQTGWQLRSFAKKGHEKPQTSRLWNAPHWPTHPLNFGNVSIDTLIILFNLFQLYPPQKKHTPHEPLPSPDAPKISQPAASSRKDQASPQKDILSEQRKRRVLDAQWRHLSTLYPRQNGDLLLHFFLYTFVQQHLPPECSTHPAWRNNPLILLVSFHQDQRAKQQGLDALRLLLDPSVAPLMPWIGSLLRNAWLQKHTPPKTNPTSEAFLHYFDQMHRIWSSAIDLFQQAERYDLLAPWLEIFSLWLAQDQLTVHWPRWLHEASHSLRMNDRQTLTDELLQAIGLIAQIQDIAEDIRSLHPTERDAAHRLFLQTYAETRFAEVFQTYKELKRTLQPTLG
ncbi:hypothetical protein L6R29_16130 [Myxococcota bacterium]|nr:hypothetical protein [Myxococcota bacterium]